MDLELEGNVALVTASTSVVGLGHACAEALSRQGADVALCGRNIDQLAMASDRLDAVGAGDLVAFEADIRDPDHLAAIVEETVDSYGRLDHLVTSTGWPSQSSFVEGTDEEWFHAFDHLFMSVVWATRAAYPHLRESPDGSVVSILGPGATRPRSESVFANAFRRAIRGVIETQAREFAPDVRVNAVTPGPYETPGLEDHLREGSDGESLDRLLEAEAASVPLDRIGQPDELGDVVAFLSSQRASYLTGATVPVDGGRSLPEQ